MIKARYWLVHNVEGGPSSRKHSTFESAVSEAKRLALQQPERCFGVLELVDGFYTEKPEVRQFAVAVTPTQDRIWHTNCE